MVSSHIFEHSNGPEAVARVSPLYYASCSMRKTLQVMPTQDSFEPVLYLAIMHGDTALSDLKTGRANLKFEVSERTGQLKDLVSQLGNTWICSGLLSHLHV